MPDLYAELTSRLTTDGQYLGTVGSSRFTLSFLGYETLVLAHDTSPTRTGPLYLMRPDRGDLVLVFLIAGWLLTGLLFPFSNTLFAVVGLIASVRWFKRAVDHRRRNVMIGGGLTLGALLAGTVWMNSPSIAAIGVLTGAAIALLDGYDVAAVLRLRDSTIHIRRRDLRHLVIAPGPNRDSGAVTIHHVRAGWSVSGRDALRMLGGIARYLNRRVRPGGWNWLAGLDDYARLGGIIETALASGGHTARGSAVLDLPRHLLRSAAAFADPPGPIVQDGLETELDRGRRILLEYRKLISDGDPSRR